MSPVAGKVTKTFVLDTRLAYTTITLRAGWYNFTALYGDALIDLARESGFDDEDTGGIILPRSEKIAVFVPDEEMGLVYYLPAGVEIRVEAVDPVDPYTLKR